MIPSYLLSFAFRVLSVLLLSLLRLLLRLGEYMSRRSFCLCALRCSLSARRKDVQFIKVGQTAASGCMGDRELVSWLDNISIFVSFKYDLALDFEFLFPHI